MKFLLPALFLLVLGAGNILVGYYKEWQYRQVYEELVELEPTQNLSSVLGRIETAQQITDRREQRQLEANERRNFYRLVAFGGKIFISASAILLCLALMAYTLRQRQTQTRTENDQNKINQLPQGTC